MKSFLSIDPRQTPHNPKPREKLLPRRAVFIVGAGLLAAYGLHERAMRPVPQPNVTVSIEETSRKLDQIGSIARHCPTGSDGLCLPKYLAQINTLLAEVDKEQKEQQKVLDSELNKVFGDLQQDAAKLPVGDARKEVLDKLLKQRELEKEPK